MRLPLRLGSCRPRRRATLGFTVLSGLPMLVFLMTAAAVINSSSPARAQSVRSPLLKALIREERQVLVDGVLERWRLQWQAPPEPECDAEGPLWLTCPCGSFAFGEAGLLDLIRVRDSREIDRLPLSPLFSPISADLQGKAIVQRWAVTDADWKMGESEKLPALVRKRPPVQVMNFGDYDHDGRATEFYLQTASEPCAKNVGIVVGISQGNGRLHAFGSERKPEKPLVLRRETWAALLLASQPVEVTEWPCGDHGRNAEAAVSVRAAGGHIQGYWHEYDCLDGGRRRGRLLSKEPLQ